MRNLDQVVLEALDLHDSCKASPIRLPAANRRLIIGSGNALPAGKIAFADEPAVFCDEGQYERVLERDASIDSAIVVSASGTKHAPIVLSNLLNRGIDCHLLTCDSNSPAAQLLSSDRVSVTPSIDEPITYNVSTFMGMMLTKTRENTRRIKQHIIERVEPLTRDLAKYQAFYLIVPPEFDLLREMLITKFDELFGGRINGRCYTVEQTFHAKTVVPWDQELFISFGYDNRLFGTQRLDVPLPEPAGHAAMLATGYFVIGRLQSQSPSWFHDHADRYREVQIGWFRDKQNRE